MKRIETNSPFSFIFIRDEEGNKYVDIEHWDGLDLCHTVELEVDLVETLIEEYQKDDW